LQKHNSLTPLDAAADAVAFFLAMLAWVFFVWFPIILFAVFYRVRTSQTSLISLASVILGLLILSYLFGALFKWLAEGVLQRKRIRMGLLALVLLLQSGLIMRLFFVTKEPPVRSFSDLLNIAILLFAAGVTTLALLRHRDEERHGR
jgi:hypothetical protein